MSDGTVPDGSLPRAITFTDQSNTIVDIDSLSKASILADALNGTWRTLAESSKIPAFKNGILEKLNRLQNQRNSWREKHKLTGEELKQFEELVFNALTTRPFLYLEHRHLHSSSKVSGAFWHRGRLPDG